MTPEIIARDSFMVVGVRAVVDLSTGTPDALWEEKFLPRRSELVGVNAFHYGVFNVLHSESKGLRYEYVAGVAAESLENIPEGMVGWLIPAGTYAQVSNSGLVCLGDCCRRIIADWLPDSGYKMMTGPIFSYTNHANPLDATAIWKINIPIEKPEVLAELEKWLG